MSDDIFAAAPEGQIYVCGACGKTSPTKAPTKKSAGGWDESCMLNSVLCYQERNEAGFWQEVSK